MAKRKRHVELDAHQSAIRDIAMFAAKAESHFYQRIAQIQNDIQSGRHAIYHFTGNREASPAVTPEMKGACPLPAANGVGQQDLVQDEPRQSDQLTSTKEPAQDPSPVPVQIDDFRVTPVGIPGAKNCLLGFSFVFTGDFEGLTRENAKVLVELHGGRVDDFPTTKTNYVVLGNDVDPYKLQILEKKHLKTIREADLYDLIRIFSRSPHSDVLRLKRQRIEQDLKESVESRTSGSRDRYTDEQNSAWSGEPNAADDALRFAQSRISLESAYHATAPLASVSNPASSANDSLYSSRASWTPEAQPVVQPPLPYAQVSMLDSDVLKVIAALPAQSVNPIQTTSAAVESAIVPTKAPLEVHDNPAKPTTLDVSQSGGMRVIGSLHDLVESDETREDSYSPPSADVPSLVIDLSGPDGRPKRLRGVSQPTVGPLAHSYMLPSNVDADADNKSESDYSPPPAEGRYGLRSMKPLGSGLATKEVELSKKERKAANLQRAQEQVRAKAAKKARNREKTQKYQQKAAEARAAAGNATAPKVANKAAAKKLATQQAATQKATTQPRQIPQAPRKSRRLLQIALDKQDSADLVEVLSSANAAPSQYAAPSRAPPAAPKAARVNQERNIAQQPVQVRQVAQESSADDESWQPKSRIKRESESAPAYSRYNVDTDSRKLLMRHDGGVDIGINSPAMAPDSQLPYGQKALPQQWPYQRDSRVQANVESSEEVATTTRKRNNQKHATRTQPNGHSTVRPVAARHGSVQQETLPPPPRRRIIVDEYGNKYIAIPATGPFPDMPELQDLLAGAGEPGLSARENAAITEARQHPKNVIDLEDSDCYEDPESLPTAPKAMLRKQKHAAQSGVVTLTKSQKRKAHRAQMEQQQRDQHEQHRTALKQKKNATKAAKAQAVPSNNVQESNIPTYDTVPYDYNRVPYGKRYVDPIAPYLPELHGFVQPPPPQISGHAQTPLPPMSARIQAPVPLAPGVPFQPSAMGAPFQPMYGQFPPPPPMAGFGGPPRPYSAQPGFAPGQVPFQQMPVMPNNPGFPVASPYVQNPPYVQTPVFGQMSMYAPQPSPFLSQMAPAR